MNIIKDWKNKMNKAGRKKKKGKELKCFFRVICSSLFIKAKIRLT